MGWKSPRPGGGYVGWVGYGAHLGEEVEFEELGVEFDHWSQWFSEWMGERDNKKRDLLSQSAGVRGSMLMVCACGGSTCRLMPTYQSTSTHCLLCFCLTMLQRWYTFCPSAMPSRRAKVASSSTTAISWSLDAVFPLLPAIPSRPTTAANLCLLCMPVHPTNMDLDVLAGALSALSTVRGMACL